MNAVSKASLKGGRLGGRHTCAGRDDDLERREIDLRGARHVGEHREYGRHAFENRDVLAREHPEDLARRQGLSRVERRARAKRREQRRDEFRCSRGCESPVSTPRAARRALSSATTRACERTTWARWPEACAAS